MLVDAQEELTDLERNAKAEQKARSQRERGVCFLTVESVILIGVDMSTLDRFQRCKIR